MPERLYFDCNACFGPFPRKDPDARWSLDHLLEDLDLAGIAGALVHHRQAIHYDPMLGNLRLLEDIAPYRERLQPCWIAIPSLGDGFPSSAAFVAEMRRHDVRAVRLEHEAFGVPIEEDVWADLRDALRDAGVLCVVPVGSYDRDLNRIDRLLTIFEGLPTLIVNHGWPQWRQVFALMRRHAGLHLEFSQFQANRAIEVFAGAFGSKRCLFGTGLPDKAPGAARGFLDLTLLDDAEAAAIAGGNLRRLLGGAGPMSVPTPGRWHDAITAALRPRRAGSLHRARRPLPHRPRRRLLPWRACGGR